VPERGEEAAVSVAGGSRLLSVTRESHRVSPLELFFDLVFVYALTQVTLQLADHSDDWQWVVRSLLVLAVMWWPWVGFTWVYNLVAAEDGLARAVLVAAMAGMFVLALAIPEAFDDRGAAPSGPLLFVAAYLVVRLLHVTLFLVVGRGDPRLMRTLARFCVPLALGTGTLAVASTTSGWLQTGLWALALVLDYGLTGLLGNDGWVVRAPGHFAERHGLIIIVALGETVVSIGVGASEGPVTYSVVVAAVLGIVTLACLWWTYFDVVALVAERRLSRATGSERVAIARDSYSYLHLPMVAGIVFLALGLKKAMTYVADGKVHDGGLHDIPLAALYGGVALYLLAHIGFRLRNVGSVNWPRLALAVLLVAAVPVAGDVPALGQLALLCAALVTLVAYETVHHREARHQLRHSAPEHEPA
jgi:low temperature requirement protein LtrA